MPNIDLNDKNNQPWDSKSPGHCRIDEFTATGEVEIDKTVGWKKDQSNGNNIHNQLKVNKSINQLINQWYVSLDRLW